MNGPEQIFSRNTREEEEEEGAVTTPLIHTLIFRWINFSGVFFTGSESPGFPVRTQQPQPVVKGHRACACARARVLTLSFTLSHAPNL